MARRLTADIDDDAYFPGPPDLALLTALASNGFMDVMARVKDFLDAGTPLL